MALTLLVALLIMLLILSIPGVHFQYCYQLSSGAGFRSSLQPSWSSLLFVFSSVVEELYGTRYQSGSISLVNVVSGFHCMRSFRFQPQFHLVHTWSATAVVSRSWHQNDKWTCIFLCVARHLPKNLIKETVATFISSQLHHFLHFTFNSLTCESYPLQ